METLETRTSTEQKTRICGCCGNTYNSGARQQEVASKAKPNTAEEYCCDEHWASETGIYES
ncbi:MAG: hypothetical protein KKB21_04370 [Nanoarchaeota archaeon]|nr:hypothetical protein [Nanoarchaeota archaeon]MBU4086781.1 hypothetical protein [Nanoarchaeota archaeon]